MVRTFRAALVKDTPGVSMMDALENISHRTWKYAGENKSKLAREFCGV
jgi:hypothetical protein